MPERREDQFILLNRKAYCDRLRERYARYGDELVQYLVERAFKPGGLRRIFARVFHPVPIEDDAMHDSMVRFLSSRGVAAFFQLAEPESRVEEEGPEKKRSKTLEIKEEETRDPTKGGYRPRVLYSPAPPLKPFIPPGSIAGAKPSTAPPSGGGQPAASPSASPSAVPEAVPVKSPPSAQPADGPWNGIERRSGQDRRSGLERRSGRDRRRNVEMVFKNRRYGSDRRSTLDRRSSRDRRKA